MIKPSCECNKEDEQGTLIDCQKLAVMKHNDNNNNTKDGDIDKVGACKDDMKSVELANTDRDIAEIDESEAKKDAHEIFNGQGSGRRRKDSSELNNEPTRDKIGAGRKKVVRRFPSEDVVHQILQYLPTCWSCSRIFDPGGMSIGKTLDERCYINKVLDEIDSATLVGEEDDNDAKELTSMEFAEVDDSSDTCGTHKIVIGDDIRIKAGKISINSKILFIVLPSITIVICMK
ncbi:hypothetical protein F8M41_001108 [Gigaspora margarita]|uniref:Uncharacterized protein n=1 Tax=Gigaspora margarita TaxID=4874 RepID=A0A8H3XHD2_GIGMA|nr:hypothetical protein F8M41_001108 [Gigaspora margarita]